MNLFIYIILGLSFITILVMFYLMHRLKKENPQCFNKKSK